LVRCVRAQAYHAGAATTRAYYCVVEQLCAGRGRSEKKWQTVLKNAVLVGRFVLINVFLDLFPTLRVYTCVCVCVWKRESLCLSLSFRKRVFYISVFFFLFIFNSYGIHVVYTYIHFIICAEMYYYTRSARYHMYSHREPNDKNKKIKTKLSTVLLSCVYYFNFVFAFARSRRFTSRRHTDCLYRFRLASTENESLPSRVTALIHKSQFTRWNSYVKSNMNCLLNLWLDTNSILCPVLQSKDNCGVRFSIFPSFDRSPAF
jgi:hypothetical protein